MNTAPPEFIVDDVVQSEVNLLPGPCVVLVGRCGDGSVSKGQVLCAAYRYRNDRYPDDMGIEPVREIERPVRIEVVEIQIHGRWFQQIDRGMTGALFVKGEGIDCLAPGWVLGQPVQSERASGTPPLVSEPVYAPQASRCMAT
jgi:hypothetical protein